jgi:hypothetical protein
VHKVAERASGARSAAPSMRTGIIGGRARDAAIAARLPERLVELSPRTDEVGRMVRLMRG